LISFSLGFSAIFFHQPKFSSLLGVACSARSSATDADTQRRWGLRPGTHLASDLAVGVRCGISDPGPVSGASRCPYLAGNTRSLSEHGSQAARADDSAMRESRLVPGYSSKQPVFANANTGCFLFGPRGQKGGACGATKNAISAAVLGVAPVGVLEPRAPARTAGRRLTPPGTHDAGVSALTKRQVRWDMGGGPRAGMVSELGW